MSRTHYPKQFLRLTGEHSLLQQTLQRTRGLPMLGRLLAVTNEAHRFLVAEQLLEIGESADILLEPSARNTAPAIAAAAQFALRTEGTQLLLVLPSDHVVADVEAFNRAVMDGLPHAMEGRFVTFGIVPNRAETGFGYIQRGQPVAGGYALERFVEKPDQATAQKYLEGGDFYWNSGMFLMRADVLLETLHRLAPDIAGPVRAAVMNARMDLDFVRLDADEFSHVRADSIDYAVMERVDNAVVIPLDAGWNDIGAWDALCASTGIDADGNTVSGDVVLHDTRGSLIRAESRLVATVGVTDLVVVETADAVLIAPKSRAQDVKRIVEQLKAEGRGETEFHTQVHRPWGSYEGVADGGRYQVKRLVVKPGRSLSLQKHHHRAEHWVVVSGTARVTRGDDTILLSENQSTYIPLGTVHRLENPGMIDLEIIEVQSGTYLGEDDIVRLEDTYGRS
jgi:mannose-1-phosphate guanylyltransferase/mannose-6-phosphate isomerase